MSAYLPGKLPDVLKRSVQVLKDCVQGLEVLSASTEDQFLDIGTRLTAFYEDAAKVSALAKTMAEFLSGKEIAGTIEKLNILMDGFQVQLQHFDSVTGESISKLDSISGCMEDVESGLEELGRVNRVLGGLGFCTGLQNAILKKPVDGIRMLGEDVKKLSLDIKKKSDHIQGKTETLSGVIQTSRLKIGDLSSVQQKKAINIFRPTISNIALLSEKYGLSAVTAKKISSASEEISQCILEIVTFIQFHDIMRQRFEKSMIAFNAMAAEISETSGGDELLLKAAALADFCFQEGAPLQNTRADFIAVVKNLVENLDFLSVNVRNLLRNSSSLVSAGNSIEGSFLSMIEESLNSVTLSISEISESGMVKGELSAAIAAAADMLRELEGFIEEIDDIGDEIELIALNAAIKADQIGKEGKAVGIVAVEIQRVAAEAKTHTSEISAVLKEAGGYAEELSREVSAGESAYALKTGELSERFGGFAVCLRDLNKRSLSVSADIEDTGAVLVRELDSVIERLTIHRDVDFVVEDIMANLEKIVFELTGKSGVEAETPVMNVLSPFHSCDLPVMAGGLGDNVELF
jgi:methyl-accepting chemotaxis protein